MNRYDMPKDRSWCGIHRCCREADHNGACEVDITELDFDELEAIRMSGSKSGDGPAIVAAMAQAWDEGWRANSSWHLNIDMSGEQPELRNPYRSQH